jgi:hypothetical protein
MLTGRRFLDLVAGKKILDWKWLPCAWNERV